MPERLFAIGDIHGCSRALDALLAWLEPGPHDTVVTLGDYVRKGPDGPGVIDRLIELAAHCRLVCLRGNHDEMLLKNFDEWSATGQAPGYEARHLEFLRGCRLWYETPTHFFVHASYDPRLSLQKQDRYTLQWQSLRDEMPKPHRSGKTAVMGHTSQRNGEVLRQPGLICIDTWCCGGGWLTALELPGERLWQVDREGRMRGDEWRSPGG